MRNYRTAQNVAKAISALGWLTIIVGMICVFAVIPFGLTIGAALAIGGILQIASAQITLAVIDTAENSSRMVEILNRAFPQDTPNRWESQANAVIPTTEKKSQVQVSSHRWTEVP